MLDVSPVTPALEGDELRSNYTADRQLVHTQAQQYDFSSPYCIAVQTNGFCESKQWK